MSKKAILKLLLLLINAVGLLATNSSAGEVLTFSNSASITVPGTGSAGQASPYPSVIDVSGVGGEVTKATVTLDGINFSCPPDLDVLVQGPAGQNVLLMSDNGHCFIDAIDVTLTFDDAVANFLPEAGSTGLVSGNFRPSNSNPLGDSGDFFVPPGPISPYGTALSAFNSIDPNGTWKLFVMDDTSADIGNIGRGWTLSLEVVPEPTTFAMMLLGASAVLFKTRRRA